MKFSCFLLIFSGFVAEIFPTGGQFTERFRWSPTNYVFKELPNATATQPNKVCSQQHKTVAVYPWKDKIFLSLNCVSAYSKTGTFPSLFYANLNTTEKSPPLTPYPKDESHLIQSAHSLEVDKCDRLWLLDIGNRSIVIIDLVRSKLIRQIRVSLSQLELFNMETIAIDVKKGDCENAYAYFPNYFSAVTLVYNYANNTYWLTGKPNFVNKTGEEIQLVFPLGGMYSFAPATEKDGAFFVQPFSSEYLLTVSDPKLNKFTVFGSRTPSHTAKVLRYDEKNSVLFYDLQTKNSIGCWNRKRFPDKFSANTTHLVKMPNNFRLNIVPQIHTDNQNTLWITVDEVKVDGNQQWFYKSVYTVNVKELINGTVCDSI